MDLWQWYYRNRKGKKNLQLICGNAIVKIGDKICDNCGNCDNAIIKNERKKQKIVVGVHSDTTKVEVESSCKWMYFLFTANGLQFFFFSNPIIIPKMVGAHSCSFKEIRFPIAKELIYA